MAYVQDAQRSQLLLFLSTLNESSDLNTTVEKEKHDTSGNKYSGNYLLPKVGGKVPGMLLSTVGM